MKLNRWKFSGVRFGLLLLCSLLAPTSALRAQENLNDQLRKVLTDPDARKALEKAQNLAPIELFRTQILPNDVLTYVKPNQWAIAAFEIRSNLVDYVGSLETAPLPMEGMPQEVVLHREARLTKGRRTRLTLPVILPRIPKEVGIILRRPESLREDEVFNMPLRLLEPHQMLIPVLTRGANDGYNRLNAMKVMAPLSAAHRDPVMVDRQRYHRFVLPADPELPLLPNHPLAWTAISHVIWDGMEPEKLSIGQQESLIDWIHWGGQLVLVGGAGPSFNPLLESFLAPYLPARPNGRSASAAGADLVDLSRRYYPLAKVQDPEELLEGTQSYVDAWKKFGHRYELEPAPIRVERDKPLFLQGLEPLEGSKTISLGNPDLPPLAVERRVGRGRIIMTSFSLIDPILMAWPGYETLVRRVVLRRPEERMVEPLRYHPSGGGFDAPRYDFWSGPDLTWTRILARDLGAPTRRVDEEEDRSVGRISNRAEGTSAVAFNPIDFYQVPVAEWIENSAMPNLARAALQEASGIEIPNARFVLKVILAYVICLVPLNWLICRYGLGRREWAWVLAPLFAFGFAIVVERAAAYDVGFDSTCDEIDLLETHGDHPRGHISRFASLYTTGRAAYSISFPEDPTALVLPMSTGRSIRGEESQKARFQILPHPALTEYQLQPRSLSMYRAEQLATLDGVPAQSAGVGPSGRASIRNTGPVELRDAVLVELKRSGSICRELGSIAPGATVEAGEASIPIEEYVPGSSIPSLGDRATLRPADFLETLVRSSTAARPEDEGELRLIAWTDRILPGQVIEPPVDRHRGFTLVVAHLRGGDLPDPDSPDYDARGDRSERLPERIPTAPVLNVPTPFGFRGAGMPGLPPGIQIPRGAMPAAPGRGRSKGEAGENEADDLSPEDFSSEKPQR